MKKTIHMNITREKHLDHLVRVVPLIVLFYAIQSYVIMKIDGGPFSSTSLTVLGGLLALMISGFIFYDIKHQVVLKEDSLEIHFLGKKTIFYHDILDCLVHDPDESFSNVKIKTTHGTFTFFFVDEAEKIKAKIDSYKNEVHSEAA